MTSKEIFSGEPTTNVPGDPIYDMQPPKIQRLVAEIRQAQGYPARLMGISRSYRKGILRRAR